MTFTRFLSLQPVFQFLDIFSAMTNSEILVLFWSRQVHTNFIAYFGSIVLLKNPISNIFLKVLDHSTRFSRVFLYLFNLINRTINGKTLLPHDTTITVLYCENAILQLKDMFMHFKQILLIITLK